MRPMGVLLVVLVCGFFLWGTSGLPERGDPEGPAHTHVAVYYIENALADSDTYNMVAAVLADYRVFDTFGEAVVVVAAALSVLLILLRRREDEDIPDHRSVAKGMGPGAGKEPGGGTTPPSGPVLGGDS